MQTGIPADSSPPSAVTARRKAGRRLLVGVLLVAGVGLAWEAAADAAGGNVAGQTPPKPAGLSQSDKAVFRAAFRSAKQRNWNDARARAAQGRDPLPRKILRWLEMTEHGNDYGFADIAGFITANPDWPRLGILRRRADEAIDETTSPDAVLSWFKGAAPRTTDGKIAYGQALITSGRVKEGHGHLRDAWIYGNFSRRDEVLFMRQYRKLFSVQDHWRRLDNLLWNGHRHQARRMLGRVSAEQRALAAARLSLRRRRGGVDRAIARVPSRLQADPGLLYERLRWRRRKGRDLDALEILRKPPAQLVRPELWANERIILARRLLANGQITDAYRTVRDHGVDDSHIGQLVEAEWLAGWIALRFMNQGKEALERFENLYRMVQYPVSRARAAYWAGRAASSLGDGQQANDWFQIAARHPTTYHGQLATQELGQKIPPFPEPPVPDEAERKRFGDRELTRAVRVLHDLGEDRLVRTFFRRLGRIDKSLSHWILAGDLARSIGRTDLAVWIARYAQRDGDTLLGLGYPLYRMPEGYPERALLLAMARQESNFDPNAVSRAGAQGIMQVMPRTARKVARANGWRYSRSRLTGDPDYNIRLGSSYLREMLARFDGSYVLAIAAYNAGPNAVARWLRKNGDPRNGVDDPIDWIELIPYRETRTYVHRVLGNLQIFRNRLQPGRMAVTLHSDLRR